MEIVKVEDIPKLALSIIIAQSADIIGVILTDTSVETWYQSLNKRPPSLLVGRTISLVWIVLYTLMGMASYLAWNKDINRSEVKRVKILYFVQLLVNILWSYAFFYQKPIVAGIGVIAVLWALILATSLKFWKLSKAAGSLMSPYLIWVSFATFLNYTLWRLNR